MKKRRNRTLLLLAAVLAALAVLGSALYQGRTRRTLRLIYIPKTIDGLNDFWTSLLQGTKMAAEEYGAELTILAGSNETDEEGQIAVIREAIEEKPDAILLSPVSYTAVTEAAKEIKEAGIRLVLVDSTLDEDVEDLLVSTDNISAGEQLGHLALQILPKDPVIGVVAHVEGSSTALQREEGLRAGLGDAGAHIAELVFGDSDYDKSYEVTRQMLRRHPDMNVIIGLNEYSAVGAVRAVKDAGLTEQIRMVGFDSSIEEIQYLEEGILEGIVVQKAFNMGYLGVEKTVELLLGTRFEEPVDSGAETVTRENLYDIEIQKMIFPFTD